jgi:hypothetical protein
MKRALLRAAIGIVMAVVLVYAGDYLRWRTGFPGHRLQFGTVHIQPYVAVPQKNGHTEYMLDDPIDAPCATSLFPHGGAPPCWYLQRHTNHRTNL